MSQRGKRPNPNSMGVDGSTPVKRRKGRPPTVSADADDFSTPSNSNGGGQHSSVWQARPHLDLKMSSIYNRSAPEAPAELFRKDLISAMKLPDSEPLSHEEYWLITDQWKQEWERGVQVPVNPDSLPEPIVRSISENYYKGRQDFKLPKNKYIRITKDENFSHDKNYLSNTPALADSACSYDLDQLDEAWLKEFNGERSMCGLSPVNEEQFERIIEELETRCFDKIQAIMKSEDGLGIEFDENVICDVCRSPDSEEANEMVFCDNCNICVHQACYGITTIPSGQWLCRTCSMGQKPECVLCPNKGGAMKSTRSGTKWAHVSCALWIPEVSIGSVDRMEPITKISSIPQSRWALICVLCRERVGACIQCSVKTCKTAYHVTCAFQHGLEMRAIIEDENAEDGVKLRSYCTKHSVKKEPKNSANAEKNSGSASEEEGKTVTNKKKVRKEMTTEERNHARLARLVEIQSEFDKHVSVKDISCHLLDVDQEGINHIYNYWILKRKAGGNDPLLLPKAGDADVLSQTEQEQVDLEKMKMFVHLRQDLERVRNLCYMVSRREKLSRSFFKIREQIFQKQVTVLSGYKKPSKQDEISIHATMEANHGPSIYDVLYSSESVMESQTMNIEDMIDAILGNTTKPSKELNGSIKKLDAISRYSKLFNGGNISSASSNKKSNNIYESMSSDTDGSRHRRNQVKSHVSSTSNSTSPASSSEDESPKVKSPAKLKPQLPLPPPHPVTPTTQPKKKGRPPGSTKQAVAEKRRQMAALASKEKTKPLSVDTSSEDDTPAPVARTKLKSPINSRNRLPTDDVHLTDESDELVPIRNSSGHSIPTTGNSKRVHSSAIYSDSDSSSTDKDNKTDHTFSDSQQQPFRTKAAMKEFNINDVLLFKEKQNKKAQDALEQPAKKSNSLPKKSATSPTTKKPPSRRESKASPIKARRMSTKPPVALSSDSEAEAVPAIKEVTKERKSQKKDVIPDFLVVPQREAAKKASENLMKTNSTVIAPTPAVAINEKEKSRKELKEKPDESMSSKAVSESEKEKETKESKPKSSKSSKESKKASTRDEAKAESKRPIKDEKVDREKEIPSADIIPADILPYVPQRQAAKKAAEHIKGLGAPTPAPPVIVEEKPKVAAPAVKKTIAERRKSVAVDLSSSSTSSSSSASSSASSSDSESETESPRTIPTTAPLKSTVKAPPPRRPSTAVGLKQKPKDSPFLDKVTKSTGAVKSSSSSSSSDSDSSSSDGPHTSRLSEKGNHSKRKSTSEKSTSKKSLTSSPKKSAVAVAPKKEADKLPSRRPSTAPKTQPLSSPSGSKTSTSNRSPQKSAPEPPAAPETPTVTSRKRSTSTTTPSKLPNNNKSRAAEPSKGDLAKLPDQNLKESEMNPPSTKSSIEANRKRRMSVVSPQISVKDSEKEKEKVEKEPTLRRSSRSDSTSTKSVQEKVPEKVVEPEKSLSRSLSSSSTKSKDVKDSPRPIKNDIETPESAPVVDEVRKRQTKTKTEIVEKLAEKKPCDVDNSEVRMDIDDSIAKRTMISEQPTVPPVSSQISPMVSIPTANLAPKMKPTSEALDDAFNKVLRDEHVFNSGNSIFNVPKVNEKEDTERETMSLIEKLRQKKSNKTPNIGDNNNIVNDVASDVPVKLSPCMHQNEKKSTPKHDLLDQPPQGPLQQHQLHSQSQVQQNQMPQQQPQHPAINAQQNMVPFKTLSSPSLLAKKDQEFNELKKTSPWHQHQTADNNYQRNILTSNNNKMNSTIDQLPAPASCMVIEQQQKLAACQKMSNEENNMLASNRGQNFVMPPMGMNMLNEQPSHMEITMNMQVQQQQAQKWPKAQDPKSLDLKMMQQQQANMHGAMMKRNQPGLENINMINDLNQQAMKNSFPQLPHKDPLTGDFTNPMMPHGVPGNYNAYNFSENAAQNNFTGAVSLFPPNEMNVQVPFPSPGQAMFAPNFSNSFTNTSHQNPDHSMMMPGGMHNKINNAEMMANNMRFDASQNFCNPMNQQLQPQRPNDLPIIPNIPRNIEDKHESHKKSPSKSTRSSPRNSTPTHGSKTPQKSPSKSPRQPSTPASVESMSKQNNQKGKSTPNANEPKQRKSRTNSQASPATTPAEHRNNKGRGRNNKNTKNRFPPNSMYMHGAMSGGMDYPMNRKFAGTVYEFDDNEFSQTPTVENLRAMRDRTKSVDTFKLNRDASSQSPKFTKGSVKQQALQHSSLALNNHGLPGDIVNDATALPVAPTIVDLNLVNIPGPVDMRTYNSFDNTNDSYNTQLLGAFESNTLDQTLNDIDEEQEKELQIALKASNDKQKTPTNNSTTEVNDTKSSSKDAYIVEESVDSEASFAKVSLSDSRNQLKLKIKGPLGSSHLDQHAINARNPVVPQAGSSGGTSNASSSRRQMRKKELLQQYWNQDNQDNQETMNAHSIDHHTTSNTSRFGGIPKAVDSMGLGLLKDEFQQDFSYAEYKKRKRIAIKGDSHSVDVDMNALNNSEPTNSTHEVDPLALDFNKKRRNRANRGGLQQSNVAASNPPPKLKIKIGSDILETGGKLPPKKRLQQHTPEPPSFEDMRRESMNFRKQMMDAFSEEKAKESRKKEGKRDKKEKKRKKKEKEKKRSVEIVKASLPGDGTKKLKLVLKFGSNSTNAVVNASAENSNSSEMSKSTPPPLKLKISRNSTGNGEYNIDKSAKVTVPTPKSSPSLQGPLVTSTPISTNNNLQPPVIDASDINSITTKKLEISLERIEDVAKAKSELLKKQSDESIVSEKNEAAPPSSKDCEGR